MKSTNEPVVAHVVSRDGTEIGYWTSGEGPPLVLVHGTASLHTTWDALLPFLERHVTVHAVDRRGRGVSGDGPDYDVAREFEDVAAVVDAVTKASGAKAAVLGHSFGGLCAFGAATLTSNMSKLVLYEGWPSVSPDVGASSGIGERLDALLAEGSRDAFLETFYREVAMIPEEELAALRALPRWWQARVDAAHTILREFRVDAALDPEQVAAVAVPTLMLVGGDSLNHLKADYELVAAALPDARVTVLEGQRHIAHVLVPELFAEHVVSFLRDQS